MSKRYGSGFRYFPGDPPRLRQQVRHLEDLGFEPERMTEHQNKINEYNWYWARGTITKDPCERLKEKGFEALLGLLKPRGRSSDLEIKLDPEK